MKQNVRIAKEILKVAKQLMAGEFDDSVTAGEFDDSVTAGKFDSGNDAETAVNSVVKQCLENLMHKINSEKAVRSVVLWQGDLKTTSKVDTYQLNLTLSTEKQDGGHLVTLITKFSNDGKNIVDDTSKLSIRGFTGGINKTKEWIKNLEQPMIKFLVQEAAK